MTHHQAPPIPNPSSQRLTRRQLLRYGGLSLAALPLLSLTRLAQPVATETTTIAEETRAGEWAANDAVSAYTTGTPLLFTAPFVFSALGAHWAMETATDVYLLISVSPDGRTWGPWQLLHPDGHGPAPALALGRTERTFAELLHLPPSQAVRCLAVNHDQEPIALPPDLRLVYIDASAGPRASTPAPTIAAFAATAPTIVSRAGWGCNEQLRFKDGKEIWEREYYTTEKIIIHHTDTPNDQDPLQAIRAVYYYHAVTKGWGDIGYNYLIARNGVIYEGRFGGDNVVGGHALQYNYGSVGIGLLGTFSPPPPSPSPSPSPTVSKGTPTLPPKPTSTPTPTKPPVPPVITAAAEQALIQLTAYRGRFLDLQGRYFFIDKLIPNVVGHRDVLSTSCPGDTFYGQLPIVRRGAAALVGTTPAMNLEISSIAGVGDTAIVNQPYTVKVTVKNTGTALIPSYFDKGLLYREGETYDTKKAPMVSGRFRITADLTDSPTINTAKADPYRWGFGRSLNPGETAEVVCRIAFTKTGQRKLVFGLVQEMISYWAQGVDGPTVRVIAHPVDPVPKPANVGPELLYFAETQHTLRGTLLRYWNKFGGLAQFGYPLTEEFLEVSESDGKSYMVQYFERARFEQHPEHAGTDYEVQLGLVGRLFHTVDKPAPPIAGQRFFAETGHNLGGLFRTYWEQYGGLFIYGLPLTEEIIEPSRIDNKPYTVQYFERARFEYHPENTGKSQVLLGHLGRQILQDRGWLK